MKSSTLLSAVLGLLSGGAVEACSVCTCGDPLAPAGQTNLSQGEVRLGIDYEYLTASARSDDDPAFVEHLNQSTLRPVFAFNPLEQVSLVVQIPLLRKGWSVATPGYAPTELTPTGLGDVDVGARLFVADVTNLTAQSRHTFGLSAGSSFPTGENAAQANGYRLDEHAQLGTGALGPYVGALYAFRKDNWGLFANVSGKARLRNSYAYKYGDALLWTLRSEFLVAGPFALGLEIDGRFAGHDFHERQIQLNTGGLLVVVAPSVKVQVYRDFWVFGILQIPTVTHLFGEQHFGPTFTASLQYTFR